MFRKLFGKREPEPPPRDVAALTAAFAVPAVHLRTQDAPSRSHLGGTPEVPSAFVWPVRNGAPLGFLARIELAELHRALPIEWLPRTGALLFFYDLENQPWGFDPKDRGGWSVVHVAEGDAGSTARRAPATVLPRKGIGFHRVSTLPSGERDAIDALSLTDAEIDLYCALRDAPFGEHPQHQVGGFPAPVQGDEMELESQLVSHGIYCGDEKGHASPAGRPLRAGAADWRLLLQLDSDDDLDVMWGDLGRLYFWSQESAARRGDFTDAWLVLQCS